MLLQPNSPPTSGNDFLHDPQFWIATVVALIAVAFLVRALLPKFGVKFSRGATSKATLTIGGKVIKK